MLLPICLDCRHSDDAGGWRCAAFPQGIPKEIFLSDADHTKPFEGDGGIHFEPSDPDNPAKLSRNPYLTDYQSIKTTTNKPRRARLTLP